MDPFWHHNRNWMESTRRRITRRVILALVVSGIFAAISLGYALRGVGTNAVLYASIGFGVLLITAWRGNK